MCFGLTIKYRTLVKKIAMIGFGEMEGGRVSAKGV
jgi:hypothetical protein